jgi:hypothetical protein
MQSLVANDVFEVFDRPLGIPVLKGRWFLKNQLDEASDVE